MNCGRIDGICYGVKEITLLSEMSSRLMHSEKTEEELYPILQRLSEHLNAECAFLTLFDQKSQKIHIEAAYGLSNFQKAKGKYTIGEGIIGRVVEYSRPVIVEKISESKLFLNKTRSFLPSSGEEMSFICTPIMINGKVEGTLSTTIPFSNTTKYEQHKHFLSVIGGLLIHATRKSKKRHHEMNQLRRENTELQTKLKEKSSSFNMIGNSGKMLDIFNLIEMVAPTQSTVLIRGESGCGKELVAEAIHNASLVADKPLIKVNCSALPDSLIESELFGHEKGAFTGAETQRKGRFEMAKGGTIFLDEIGDIPLTTQVKLLRVLQEREFERIGGTTTIKVDVRIVCATNRNLEQLISEDQFREDFYYRINVFPLFLPPLRERRNDIPLLIDFFINKYNKKNNTAIKRITTAALEMMMFYKWPGNIRELENMIERSCILTRDGVIDSHHLPPTLQTADSSGTLAKGGMSYSVEKLERTLIRDALMSTKGNMAEAARQLQVTERMLTTRVKKYNIEVWRYKIQNN